MPGPLAPTQPAVQAAVTDAAINNPTAQTVGGTIASAANTPVGGTALMVGTNLGTATVGNAAIGAPEIPGLAWMVTWLVQALKQHSRFNQQNVALMTIVLIVLSIAVCYLVWNGDIHKVVSGAGMVAWQAQQNYHQWQLTGFGGLSPASSVAGG